MYNREAILEVPGIPSPLQQAVEDWAFLEHKSKKKLVAWSGCLLIIVGRLALVNVVLLGAISVYRIFILEIALTTIESIGTLRRRFF